MLRRSPEQAPGLFSVVSASGARLERTANNCLVPAGAECPVTFLRRIEAGSKNKLMLPNPTNRSVFIAPSAPTGKKLG